MMPTRSEAVNEVADNARQIICALPDPCTVPFAGGVLSLDVPDAEPVMKAKARSGLDYEKLRKWIAPDGEIYFEALTGAELKEYLKTHKGKPPVVPEDDVPEVVAKIRLMKLRQTVTLIRACAEAAVPGQLPMDDRRLTLMVEAEGGYSSPVAIAARRMCGIDAPEEDTDAQPDPFASSRSAGTDGESSDDSPPPPTGASCSATGEAPREIGW